jgi:hypothetical protein
MDPAVVAAVGCIGGARCSSISASEALANNDLSVGAGRYL